jgi:spore photoproduct lyase
MPPLQKTLFDKVRRETGLGGIKLYEEPIPNIDGMIVYFNKTPSDIVCPHFWEIRWAFGCPFECAYCYLQGTGRGNKSPRYRPINKVILAVDKAFKNEYFQKHPSIFNSGELSDSLMYPTNMKQIVDFFETQEVHKLLLLTKSSNVDWLAQNPRKQTIASFSINASEISTMWEKKAPLPQQRIDAARRLIESGYEVRIRIDPIFPVENWQSYYENLIYSILSTLPRDPNRITLGTPRGLAKTLIFAKDRSWERTAFTETPEHSGWGKKAPASLRMEIYTFIFDKLATLGFDKSRIALCKETLSIWKALKLDPTECKCNCVW